LFKSEYVDPNFSKVFLMCRDLKKVSRPHSLISVHKTYPARTTLSFLFTDICNGKGTANKSVFRADHLLLCIVIFLVSTFWRYITAGGSLKHAYYERSISCRLERIILRWGYRNILRSLKEGLVFLFFSKHREDSLDLFHCKMPSENSLTRNQHESSCVAFLRIFAAAGTILANKDVYF